jgi:DNA polymerase-3 subunit delta'
MPLRTLIGHGPTLTLVSRAIEAGTLPPSLIFAGPAGVGKRAAADAIAQVLNCTAPVSPSGLFAIDACGECLACRRIEGRKHFDVHVLEPEATGNINIDAVRDVLAQTAYKPYEGRRRVVIIDDADALGAAGQNALLKTLEEPPPSLVSLLVTHRDQELLPTVRSRCPVVRFAPIAAADIATWLIDAQGVSESTAHAIAAVSRGSLAVARATAEGGAETVREAAERVLAAVADARDPRARLEATRDLVGKGKGTGASEREALATHLHALAALLRDLGALATGSPGSMVNVDLQASLGRIADRFDARRTVRAFGAVDEALAALDKNASPKIVADWIVLQL